MKRKPHTNLPPSGIPHAAPKATHALEEHTGEVRLRIEAESLEGIFEEAARALCLLTAGDEPVATNSPTRVHVQARDREALLVEWLNELIFLGETKAEVYPITHVDRLSDCEIDATIRGARPQVIRTAVKAATMHDLSIAKRDGDAAFLWLATVVLDV